MNLEPNFLQSSQNSSFGSLPVPTVTKNCYQAAMERPLNPEQYSLFENLTKRQIPSCVLDYVPPDYLRKKIRWRSAEEMERANVMISQLTQEEQESRCTNIFRYVNKTFSAIHLGPSMIVRAY